jgi:formyltetrahydrofolate deformylase
LTPPRSVNGVPGTGREIPTAAASSAGVAVGPDRAVSATRLQDQRDLGRLVITCPDRPGIVAAVSRVLFDQGANIVHADQHSTAQGAGQFYMRIEFRLPDLETRGPALEAALRPVAGAFGMEWRLAYAARPKRLAIFVSRAEHALLELLWAQRAGDLRAELALVISNHPTHRETVNRAGIPYFHVPVEPDRKTWAEEHQLRLLEDHRVDAVVLARYMQVLSPAFLERYPARIINIHHSFLPAFVGANPYAAAHERGVKLIGATAHYVSEELDAGPIIEQDVQRVDHRHSADDLRRMGRYIERVVLARAVSWHVDDRVLLDGNKTIVFA